MSLLNGASDSTAHRFLQNFTHGELDAPRGQIPPRKAKPDRQPTLPGAWLPLKILLADYSHPREMSGPLACSQTTQTEEEGSVFSACPQATLVHRTS